jgi:hypothetical protein
MMLTIKLLAPWTTDRHGFILATNADKKIYQATGMNKVLIGLVLIFGPNDAPLINFMNCRNYDRKNYRLMKTFARLVIQVTVNLRDKSITFADHV